MRKSIFWLILSTVITVTAHAQSNGIGTNAPASSLDVRGSFAGQYREVTATGNIAADDYFVAYKGTGAGILTLPAAVSGTGNFKGRIYYVKNSTSDQSLKISGNGTEKIDDSVKIAVLPGTSIGIMSTGATTGRTWEILGIASTTTNPTQAFVISENSAQDASTAFNGQPGTPEVLTFAPSGIKINSGNIVTFNNANDYFTINADGIYTLEGYANWMNVNGAGNGTKLSDDIGINFAFALNGTALGDIIGGTRYNFLINQQDEPNSMFTKTTIRLSQGDRIYLVMYSGQYAGSGTPRARISKPTSGTESRRMIITRL